MTKAHGLICLYCGHLLTSQIIEAKYTEIERTIFGIVIRKTKYREVICSNCGAISTVNHKATRVIKTIRYNPTQGIADA